MSGKIFPARVIKVLDDGRVVINRGKEHGLRSGQSFLIYALGGEIADPDTGGSLGILEITKGTGVVDHLQDKMATIISNVFEFDEEEISANSITAAIMGGGRKRRIKHRVEFNEVTTEDYAKPI